MKTEKQIELFAKTQAEHVLEHTKDCDRIFVSNMDMFEVLPDCRWEGIEGTAMVPPLQKGIIEFNIPIEIKDEDEVEEILGLHGPYSTPETRKRIMEEINNANKYHKMYVYYDCKYEEDFYVAGFDVLMKDSMKENYEWLGNIILHGAYTIDKKGNWDSSIVQISTPTIRVYMKQNRKEKEINNYVRSEDGMDEIIPVKNVVEDICTLFQNLNWLSEHPQYKEIEARQRRTGVTSKKPKQPKESTEPKEEKPREIVINGIKFKTRNKKVATVLGSRTPKKLLGCWNVRGHFRHYHSGKVVYIKPYQKGSDTQKQLTKKYIIE